jgi:hypothetical protein
MPTLIEYMTFFIVTEQVQEHEQRLKDMILQNDQLMARLKDANLSISAEVVKNSPAIPRKKPTRPRNKKRKPMEIKLKISTKNRQTRIERVKRKGMRKIHTEDLHYSSTKIVTRQRKSVVTMDDKVSISILPPSSVTTISAISLCASTQNVQNTLTSNGSAFKTRAQLKK